jgi:hypothetical protein
VPETRPPGSTRALGRAFSLRLGLWYALLFLAGGASLLGLTYALLEASLRERDRELVTSAFEQYVGHYDRGGLPALSAAVSQDRMAGRNEGLVVRLTGTAGQAAGRHDAVLGSVLSQFELLQRDVARRRDQNMHLHAK